VTKRQTYILDGAELSYYIKCLAQTYDDLADLLPNVAPRSRQKRNRVGAISFATATLDKELEQDDGKRWMGKGTQIIGVEVSSSHTMDGAREIVSINEDLQLYRDSVAVIPSTLSPADAISTATISLLGVHCSTSSLPSSTEEGKVVIVGGGEYASFLAKAHVGLGNKVSLVSARPNWSLPSATDIASSANQDMVQVLPPAVGSMSLGFAAAIGEFDTLIDTLGDEMGMGRAMNVVDNNYMGGGRFLEQLNELHGCNTYLSTLTRSQQYVLKKGLFFARDPVILYQKEVEKLVTNKYHNILPPPSGFGSTLQRLFDQSIIFPSNQNENGSHENKANFVRGWSLSDLTELKTWPSEGPARFGFPVVDLSVSSVSLRRKAMTAAASSSKDSRSVSSGKADTKKKEAEDSTKQKESSNNHTEEEEADNTDIIMTVPKSNNANATIKVTKRAPSKTAASSNPHVTTINSASDLNHQIIEPKRNCILFLTASYCQKCKRMAPQFNRIARLSSEATPDVHFAHVDISNGPRGKQLGKVLNAEKVPSVIVFKDGVRIEGKGDEASIVIERNNLKQLEEVARVLESGERNVNVESLLSPEMVKK